MVIKLAETLIFWQKHMHFARGARFCFCTVYREFMVQLPPFQGKLRIFGSILLSVVTKANTIVAGNSLL